MAEPADPREPSESRPADGEPAGPAEDEVFADLVAHFHEDPDERAWPEAEDVARPRPADPDHAGDPRTLGYVDDPDADHYVPPPPPRAGWVRPVTGLALLAIALGVVVLALPEIVSAVTSSVTQEVVGVVLVLGGVGLLVARMGDRRPDDDDPDDNGAVL
jgi:hypothetical protein